jgi:hypothetical protein
MRFDDASISRVTSSWLSMWATCVAAWEKDVAADRVRRIVAPMKIFQRAFTKWGHRNLLPMTTKASPALLPSLRHRSPSAAPHGQP